MSSPRWTDTLSQLSARYDVERELGRGGMATVLLATDRQLARPVAIKVLDNPGGDAEMIARFEQEIAIIAKLQHPNVVPVFDSGVIDGHPYFVMPYVAGESLRQRLVRDGALPIDDVLSIASDVAAGLDHAHQHAVLHRDVKPENVLLSDGRAIVADFGVALATSSAAERLTGTGFVLGTPAYMSPEQAAAERRLDARSDVYSLACVVYEALTGHPPFLGASPREVVARHLADAPPSLRTARPGISPALEQVVLGALAKNPADRPFTPGEFVARLRAAIHVEHTASTRPGSRKTTYAVSTLAAIALGVIAVTLSSKRSDAFEPRDLLMVAPVQLQPVDASLADALQGALVVALEQSAHVNVVHRQTVREALAAMLRPDTAEVTPDVAREVALRVGAKAVLLPSVRESADGYMVELAAEVAASQRPIAVVREIARSESDIVPTLGRLAGGLRRELGEPLRSGEVGMPLDFATTASVDALRAWSEGSRHFAAGRYQPAILAFREAIAHDSLFAMAHKSLGVSYYWSNDRLRGDSAFDRALRLRERLTDREKLLIEADVASWRDEGDHAVSLYRRVLERFPDDRTARRALAYAMLRNGNYAGAAEAYAQILKTDPLSFSAHINRASALAAMSRAQDALVHYRRAFQLDTSRLLSAQPLVQEYVLNTAEAGERDSAFAAVARMAAGNHASKTLGLRLAGLLLLREGRADSAIHMFQRAMQQSAPLGLASVVRNALILSRTLVWSGRHAEARAVLREARSTALNPTLPPDWPVRAAYAAWDAGDSLLARELATKALERVRTASENDQRTRLLALAALAIERDVRSAIAFADSAAVGQPDATVELMRGRTYEAAGDTLQAMRIYENASTMRRCCYENYFDVTEARFAAARLALRRGDTAAARSHVQSQLDEWSQGDTVIVAHRWALQALGRLR